jgi:hypothetical protein
MYVLSMPVKGRNQAAIGKISRQSERLAAIQLCFVADIPAKD